MNDRTSLVTTSRIRVMILINLIVVQKEAHMVIMISQSIHKGTMRSRRNRVIKIRHNTITTNRYEFITPGLNIAPRRNWGLRRPAIMNDTKGHLTTTVGQILHQK